MITVSIVDDEKGLRQSITTFVNGAPGFSCVSAYSTAEAALAGLPGDKPDVVLMDINLGGMNGIECVERLKAEVPAMQILMLTVYEDTDQIFKALSAGASGYLLKRSSPTKLLQAIREVHAGGSPMTSSIARKVVASFQKAKQTGEKQTHLVTPGRNGVGLSVKRSDLQGHRGSVGYQHRHHPHLSPADL